jgi:hypothetical protein
MPLLFYGNIGMSHQRIMYAEKFRAVGEGLYDSLKIKNLAPYHRGRMTWNHWWLRHIKRPHTCIAWNGMHDKEQLVLIPGEIGWRDALCVARDAFGPAMPSAVVFRINNHDGVYLWD